MATTAGVKTRYFDAGATHEAGSSALGAMPRGQHTAAPAALNMSGTQAKHAISPGTSANVLDTHEQDTPARQN